METVFVQGFVVAVGLFFVVLVCLKLREVFVLWKQKHKQKKAYLDARVEAIKESLKELPDGVATVTFSWYEREYCMGPYVRRTRQKTLLPKKKILDEAARYYATAEQKGFLLRRHFDCRVDFVLYVHKHVHALSGI